MSSIKRVAVIGASGNIGPAVIGGLLSAGFEVTALSRITSTTAITIPGVKVQKVDFSSLESLKAALAGHDALVSTVGNDAAGGQQLLIDAAVSAGVRRFIPSEYGINTPLARGTTLGTMLAVKLSTLDYLQAKAKEDSWFSWTGVSTGFLFDWGLETGFIGIDVAAKTAAVVDSGNEKWQASNLAHVGKVIAAVLKNPEKSANKFLSSASFNVSQTDIIETIKKLTGIELAVERLDSRQLQRVGEEKLSKGDYSFFREMLLVWNYADGAGHALKLEDSAEALLGIPQDDMTESVRAWLSKRELI